MLIIWFLTKAALRYHDITRKQILREKDISNHAKDIKFDGDVINHKVTNLDDAKFSHYYE